MEEMEDIFLRELADNLADLKSFRMPFGKYGPENCPPQGMPLYDLPLEYLLWFQQRGEGFPTGRLGELMEFVCQVKSAGAEEVFVPLRKSNGDRRTFRSSKKKGFSF